MKIRALIFTTVLASNAITLVGASELSKNRYELNPKVTRLLDNLFINKTRIASMMRLRKQLVELLYGKIQNGRREGTFEYRGKRMTLDALVTAHQHLGRCKRITDPELQQLFERVKTDLTHLLAQYARQAYGAKSLLVKLIDESLAKRKIRQSLLKNWAAVGDGQEEEQLEHDLLDFCSCRDLCLHLVYFLQDMMFSCKKAFAAYAQEVQQHAHKTEPV